MEQNTPCPLHSLFCTGSPLFHENRQSPYAGRTPLSHWKYSSIVVQNVSIHSEPIPTESVCPAQSTDAPPPISKAPLLLVSSCQDLAVPSWYTPFPSFELLLRQSNTVSHKIHKALVSFTMWWRISIFRLRSGRTSGHTSAPVPNSGIPAAEASRHGRGSGDNPLSMVLFPIILQFSTSSSSPNRYRNAMSF